MTQQFSSYTPRQNGQRSLKEAIAEVQRELEVRKRLFDKWVAQDKITWMDAHDRMERLMSALTQLIAYSSEQSRKQQQNEISTSTPFSSFAAAAHEAADGHEDSELDSAVPAAAA